ncbi:MAG: hypothetical protein ABI207_03860 [Crocinitomicaceae bacterium]
MKLKSILAIATLVFLTLGSCQKTYTCNCVTTVGGTSSSAPYSVFGTKKAATSSCKNGSTSSEGTSKTCTLN